MGRIGVKPIHQFQVQHQNDQHQLQPHQESFGNRQAPETIDELPPPSSESFHEDLYPEENQDEPSQELTMQSESQENQDSVQQQQYVRAAPQPMSRPVTTQFSHQNGKTQRPRKQPKPQSGTSRSPIQPSQHNSFPIHDPQPQPDAFPPLAPQSQSLPHPFPPAQDHYEPHTFPPTQEEEEEEAHAFPSTVPQAFPPAQDSYEPDGFPPEFPPTPNKAHAFPPPQVDPQLYSPQARPQAFVPQNHNVPVFASSQPHAGTNFPQHSLAQGSQIGMGMGQYQQGMQPASPMPHTPMMGIPFKPLPPTELWNTGLFDCMQDPTNALITACFPCLTFGQIAEIVDSGQTTCTSSGLIYGVILMFTGLACIMSCTYRTKLRSRYGLIESPAPDWVIHCFCEWCALCQEYRELHLRGLDPSIGWQGNQARKQNMQLQQATMVPPVHQAMMG